MTKPNNYVLYILSSGLLFAGLITGLSHRRGAAVPQAAVSPAATRAVAKPGSGVTATYRVTNTGGGELVLGQASTSCGCTLASISRRKLKPGQDAVITVEGSPPYVGEKEVSVRVKTNSPVQPEIVLKLTMVGTGKVPYVAFHSEAVAFGTIIAGESTQDMLFVETRESPGQDPWILDITPSSDNLIVRGGIVQERFLKKGVLIRRYEYDVILDQVTESGGHTQELLLVTREGDPAPSLRISVNWTVQPRVLAVPSSLFASKLSGESLSPMRVTLLTNDPNAALQVRSKTIPPGVQVRQVEKTRRATVFEVSLEDATVLSCKFVR